MPSLDTLLIFTAAALIMNLSPGPSNFYVLSRSLAQGTPAGLIATAGLAAGSLVHVAAAALGLSAVFIYSPVAYGLLKLAGAGYLVYLGLTYWFSAGPAEVDEIAGAKDFSRKRAGRDPQSQDGAVLPRLPAPVRRCRGRSLGAANPVAGDHRDADRDPLRRGGGGAVRAGRPDSRGLRQGSSDPEMGRGLDPDRPRRRSRLRPARDGLMDWPTMNDVVVRRAGAPDQAAEPTRHGRATGPSTCISPWRRREGFRSSPRFLSHPVPSG